MRLKPKAKNDLVRLLRMLHKVPELAEEASQLLDDCERLGVFEVLKKRRGWRVRVNVERDPQAGGTGPPKT